ncbi:hypothetical protein NLM33_46805 (plasmid) [Bradyrhizobium sp. CCGUVB1N3]|uniref:hypothetical protein n=1 Tax=Bradyrhizobium sp. CCGUVB1N3 TaxID=2949629 RepID=UPI0020B356C3|nr:hypothetical protein [Bradyrhizobium sp. CCGUVB1N3]MCP3477664.1 hypothetical protein [Bradyrhizobium sp. CCGUVB1N3]
MRGNFEWRFDSGCYGEDRWFNNTAGASFDAKTSNTFSALRTGRPTSEAGGKHRIAVRARIRQRANGECSRWKLSRLLLLNLQQYKTNNARTDSYPARNRHCKDEPGEIIIETRCHKPSGAESEAREERARLA